MPITTIVLLAVLLAVTIRGARGGSPRHSGWAWFCLWALPGFLAAFATLSFAIGLLLLPVAVVAIVVAARLTLGWEVLGLLPGIGAMCLLIAALNVGEETEIWPWAVAGAVFSAGGVVLYSALRRLTPRLTDFPPASR